MDRFWPASEWRSGDRFEPFGASVFSPFSSLLLWCSRINGPPAPLVFVAVAYPLDCWREIARPREQARQIWPGCRRCSVRVALLCEKERARWRLVITLRTMRTAVVADCAEKKFAELSCSLLVSPSLLCSKTKGRHCLDGQLLPLLLLCPALRQAPPPPPPLPDRLDAVLSAQWSNNLRIVFRSPANHLLGLLWLGRLSLIES